MKLMFRFLLVCFFTFLLMAMSLAVFAQDGGAPAPTDSSLSPWALLIGAGISVLVTVLKKVPFISNNPKLVVTVLSLVVTAVSAVAGARAGSGVWPFVLTALTQLAAAIGTHEVATKQLQS